MQWQIEPMAAWPYPDTKGRKWNPFGAKFPDTLKKLSFTSAKHGPMTYPCDAFTGRYYGDVDWQVNLRAIALGLEHLRALDRYGIAGRGEQYAGWRAIEAAAPVGFDSADAALRWLADLTQSHRGTDPVVLLRRASKDHHPDAGGDPEIYGRVDAARQLLKKARVIS